MYDMSPYEPFRGNNDTLTMSLEIVSSRKFSEGLPSPVCARFARLLAASVWRKRRIEFDIIGSFMVRGFHWLESILMRMNCFESPDCI